MTTAVACSYSKHFFILTLLQALLLLLVLFFSGCVVTAVVAGAINGIVAIVISSNGVNVIFASILLKL